MSQTSLRQRLQATLPDRADFEAFCCDHFPQVHRRFAAAMDRQAQTTLLLTLHTSKEIETAIVQWSASQAPSQHPPTPMLGRWLILRIVLLVCCVGLGTVVGLGRYQRYIDKRNPSPKDQASVTASPRLSIAESRPAAVTMVPDSTQSAQTKRTDQAATPSFHGPATVRASGSSTIVIGNQNRVLHSVPVATQR